jgi:uncharacterized protein (DUF486 family)
LLTVLLLTISNIFMTFAWYGHLRFQHIPLWQAVLVSWGIALVEYCFMVPANRIGYQQFSGVQLKMIQEVITLTVFAGFSIWFLREPIRWNHLLAFALVIAAVFLVADRPQRPSPAGGPPAHTSTP